MVSIVLCVMIFISIFSVFAYADRGFLLYEKNKEGVLTTGVWAKTTIDGGNFYYPENSKFLLYEDLYSNDTNTTVVIYNKEGNWSYPISVKVETLYFFPAHVRSIDEVA